MLTKQVNPIMQRSRSKSPNTRKSLVLSTVGTCLLFPFYLSNVCYFASFWPSILKPGCIPNLDMLICMRGQHYRCLLPVTSRPIYRDASWDEGYCKLWLVIYFFLGDDFCQKSQKKILQNVYLLTTAVMKREQNHC